MIPFTVFYLIPDEIESCSVIIEASTMWEAYEFFSKTYPTYEMRFIIGHDEEDDVNGA